MVNFSEREHRTLKTHYFHFSAILLSSVLDKSTAQPHYETHFFSGVLKRHQKDVISKIKQSTVFPSIRAIIGKVTKTDVCA